MPENKSCGSRTSYTGPKAVVVPSYMSKMFEDWSKGAIRTEPADLLRWSGIYFRMKAENKQPPVKPYVESRDMKPGPGGLSPSTLKALAVALSGEYVSNKRIEKMWSIFSLEKNLFYEIIKIGKFKTYIRSIEFIGVAAAYLNNRLRDTMLLLCDTLSKGNSKGVLLDDFVTVYRFLARLDVVDPKSSDKGPEPAELDGVTENVDSDSDCGGSDSSDFQMSSDECSISSKVRNSAKYALENTKSAEGIMAWQQDDDTYLPDGSFSEFLKNTIVRPPADDFAALARYGKFKYKPNDDDMLSLLSVSSVTSDSSVVSLVSATDDQIMDDGGEQLKTEQHIGYEEIVDEEHHSSIRETLSLPSNYDEYDIDEHRAVFDKDSEEFTEASVMDKYDTDVDMNEDNSITAEANRDFIVMMVLVETENNGPGPVVDNDDSAAESESAESVFSLLDKTDLNDDAKAVDQTDENQLKGLIFDERGFIHAGRESSDSEARSDEEKEREDSDGDQPSVRSVVSEHNSVESYGGESRATKSKHDHLARHTATTVTDDDDDYDRLDEMYSQFEGMMMDETEPPNYSKYEAEEEEPTNSSRSKIVVDEEAIECESVGTEYSSDFGNRFAAAVCFVIPGIGPALSEAQIQLVVNWLEKCAASQNNYVRQHNLVHFMCPPLDNFATESSSEQLDVI